MTDTRSKEFRKEYLQQKYTSPEDTPVEGAIGKMAVPGGKFAVARFEIKEDEFKNAWNVLMGGWMPQSGYQPDDRLCYELNHNDPKEHPDHKHIVDICRQKQF